MKQDSSAKINLRKVGMVNAIHSLTEIASTWTISTLDFYFPFVVFFYGLVVNFVLEVPYLVQLAKKEMPSQYETLEKHRKLAVFSLYAGGLWSLQNMWFS